MGVLNKTAAVVKSVATSSASQHSSPSNASRVLVMCQRLAKVNRYDVDVDWVWRRHVLRLAFVLAVTSITFWLGNVIAISLPGPTALFLCSTLTALWVYAVNRGATQMRNELSKTGGFEAELIAYEQIIDSCGHSLSVEEFVDASLSDQTTVIETFIDYIMRCIMVSRVEQKMGIPVTNRKVSRYGGRFLGAFEPHPVVLQALGRYLLVPQSGTEISRHADEIATISSNLWTLRTKPSGQHCQRDSMVDEDYVAVQKQFAQYLGRYGDANSLGVLRTLARDNRYQGLQAEAKLAIDQVKSRMADPAGDLLHLPATSKDIDLLHTRDDQSFSK